MFAPAAATRLPAAVAGAQQRVTAHAGRQQRQTQQGQPAHAELFLTGVAGARVGEIPFRVGHAVVEHALGTQHAAHLVDALPNRVRGVLALAPPVVLVVEHLTAINATRALPVLAAPARRLALRQRGRLLGLNGVFGASVRHRALCVQILTLPHIQLGEDVGEVCIRALRVTLPKDGVSVVLITSNENVLARVDANDLLIVHLKAYVTCAVEGNLWGQEAVVSSKTFIKGWSSYIRTTKWFSGSDTPMSKELSHWRRERLLLLNLC